VILVISLKQFGLVEKSLLGAKISL